MWHNPWDIRLIKDDLQDIEILPVSSTFKMPRIWLLAIQRTVLSHRIETVFQRRGLGGPSLEKLSFLKWPPSRLEELDLSFVPVTPSRCSSLLRMASLAYTFSSVTTCLNGGWREAFLFLSCTYLPINFFPNDIEICFSQRTVRTLFKEINTKSVFKQNPAVSCPLCKGNPFLIS